ncbi:MAG: HD domain-containing protein [Clostridia bacterium]|nr:HD domain-containing protein [Clostridia bacterium]
MTGKFSKVAINEKSDKYDVCISRVTPLSRRENEVRSPFTRDYTRILHSRAYSRLKHKTQVFFATQNDHICTRIEHVNHVSSIGVTIAKYFGLNEELVLAIATGHDLGHAPFGHSGERYISAITNKYLNETFWHEKNSLRFVDEYETLQDSNGFDCNLDLTYGVRDGIISHCGEVEDEYLIPRNEVIDLKDVLMASHYSPYTWEGCIVKMADNIAYIGRDIEDALRLKILDEEHIDELDKIIHTFYNVDIKKTNNTALIHTFVSDLCENSSPENGMRFSTHHLDFMKEIKKFNYEYIYYNDRLTVFQNYAELILNSLFNVLLKFYDGVNTIDYINQNFIEIYPELSKTFIEKLRRYSDMGNKEPRRDTLKNVILYRLENRQDFIKAIIDFISSMTDTFAIKMFEELTSL